MTSRYTRDYMTETMTSLLQVKTQNLNYKSKIKLMHPLFEYDHFDPTLRLKYDLYVIYSRDKRQPNVCQNIALNKGLDWCRYMSLNTILTNKT